MPFRLDEYDRTFITWVTDVVRELARAKSPVLGLITFEEQATSVGSRIRDRDGMDVDLPETTAGFEITTTVAAIRSADYDEFQLQIDQASEQMAKELMEMFVTTMNAVTEATGNVVNAQGELTFEKFYELLDTLEWGLTDDGELSVPSLVLHPDAVARLPEETPETKARVEELMQRKYEEALARRRRRRLS